MSQGHLNPSDDIAMHSTYSATDADGKEVLHSKLSPSGFLGAMVTSKTTPTTWSVGVWYRLCRD